MRIIIIHRSFALVGGAERVIIDKANYLAEKGHQVKLVSYEQGEHKLSYQLHPDVKYEDTNCRFFTLSKYSVVSHLIHFVRLKTEFTKKLSLIVERFSPEVIVLASDWTFLLKPVIKTAKGTSVMCEFHNSFDHIVKNIGGTDQGMKIRLTKAYYHHVIKGMRACACLISLTENDATHWRNYCDNVRIIPNPLTYFPDTINDIPKESGRIIFAGRLNAEKRIDRLISAFSLIADNYPQWHISIFGEGTEKNALEVLIQLKNMQKQISVNPPTDKIFDEYKKAQFLVLCSEYEARPLVLTEAMSCGTPCVSFDCPSGPSEIIEDKVTGLLAENGNIEDLAEKMEWMITHEAERLEMGKKSRLAAEKYRPAVVMKEWEKAYMSFNK